MTALQSAWLDCTGRTSYKGKWPESKDSWLQDPSSENPHVGELLLKQKLHDKITRTVTEAICCLSCQIYAQGFRVLIGTAKT